MSASAGSGGGAQAAATGGPAASLGTAPDSRHLADKAYSRAAAAVDGREELVRQYSVKERSSELREVVVPTCLPRG